MHTTGHKYFPPTRHDAEIARLSGQILAKYAHQDNPLTFTISEQGESIEIPPSAVDLLMDIFEAMAAGQGVTIIPENAELSTVQAADILKVSRPYLIKLLDDQVIPHRKVGTHRRIKMIDVMNYKNAIDAERESILDQLVAEAQEQKMGYGQS